MRNEQSRLQSFVALALIVEDADAPGAEPFCHWLVWGLAPQRGKLLEGETPPKVGKNAFRNSEWLLPDPPTGHGSHDYVFQLFALDSAIPLAPGATRADLMAAMDGLCWLSVGEGMPHVIAEAGAARLAVIVFVIVDLGFALLLLFAYALSWVMGEQGAKNLRGGKMQDVVGVHAELLTAVTVGLVVVALSLAEDQYLNAYPDVAEAIYVGGVIGAADHYLRHGAPEGRWWPDFMPAFEVAGGLYLRQYKDVVEEIKAGLITWADDHYRQWGAAEGREWLDARSSSMAA